MRCVGTRVLIGIAAAGALYLLGKKRGGETLEGLGTARKPMNGIMGSPFFVRANFDKRIYDLTIQLTGDNAEGREDALRSATSIEWGCVDDREVKAAQFRNRKDPEEWAILARSAKGDGGWQMSWFDAAGPHGDSPRRTQCEAIRELSSGYRYRGSMMLVEGEMMSDWYLEEWA